MNDDIPDIPIPTPNPQQPTQAHRNPGLQHVAGRIQRTTAQTVHPNNTAGALIGLALLLGVLVLVWWASNPPNLAQGITHLLNLLLHNLLVWFSWYGGNLLILLLVVGVLQAVFRFNLLGPLAQWTLTALKWVLISLFWMVVWMPIKLVQLLLQRPIAPSGPQSRTVQTVVLLQADQTRRVLVVFAAPHEVLLSEGDEIQGSGFTWRGKTRMHHIHNHSTGQTWRAIL